MAIHCPANRWTCSAAVRHTTTPVQGSHASWKVLDFFSSKIQDLESPGKSLWSWKVLKIEAQGPGKSWKNILEQKRQKETEVSGRKRKALEDEVASLKKRKVAVETDIESLTKDADDFAEKAEKQHKVTLISKSNAMHRAVKEKNDELTVLSQELANKLLELKNL